MRLVQFNIYFNHYLHTFMINYINYIVRVCAQKITIFVAYFMCVPTQICV